MKLCQRKLPSPYVGRGQTQNGNVMICVPRCDGRWIALPICLPSSLCVITIVPILAWTGVVHNTWEDAWTHPAPVAQIASMLGTTACEDIISTALLSGLRPSLPFSRALDPIRFEMTLARDSNVFDSNNDGTVDASEIAVAIRSALNAPLFFRD